jgi:hypothetical protein
MRYQLRLSNHANCGFQKQRPKYNFKKTNPNKLQRKEDAAVAAATEHCALSCNNQTKQNFA